MGFISHFGGGGASQDELALVGDTELAVYHMQQLPEEVRKKFTSDVGFVADYLNVGGFEGRSSSGLPM